MVIYMKPILLALLLSGCAADSIWDEYSFPVDAYETKLEWAYHNTPTANCLVWARGVRQKLTENGTDSIILAVKWYPVDHAVICADGYCADNGTLGYFPMSELEHYRVIGGVE